MTFSLYQLMKKCSCTKASRQEALEEYFNTVFEKVTYVLACLSTNQRSLLALLWAAFSLWLVKLVDSMTFPKIIDYMGCVI